MGAHVDIGAFESFPLALSTIRQNNQITLSWPRSDLEFFLLQSTSAPPPSGTSAFAPGTPVLGGGTYRITYPASEAKQFYRLFHP